MTNATVAPALSDPRTYVTGVPYDEFARRRRDEPAGWVDEVPLWRVGSSGGRPLQGTGYWAVVRYATIVRISRQPETFSSGLRGAFLADPISPDDLDRARQLLINMDAPQHTAIRQLLTAAFTPRLIDRLTASIQAHAASIVDRALDRGQIDIVRDIAAELPLMVLADLLGMPREDRHLMFEWSNNLVGFDDDDLSAGRIDRYKQTFVAAFEYAKQLAEARRRRPADDLVSALAGCEIDGRRLSEDELCHAWLLLVVGGNESTRHFLSGSLLALLEHPDERNRLAAEPALTATAVEELLRWVSPVMQFRRTVAREVEIDGQQMRKGDKVLLYYVSANRDEAIFDAPDRLDLARAPNPHLAFGVGAHFCLGARLSRVEAIALLDALRPHLSRLELAGPVRRLASNFMNGIKSMPGRFSRQCPAARW